MSSLPNTLGTPLVHLARFAPDAALYGKAEFMLPTGSAYDRIAGRLVDAAPGERLVVASAGSAALAFAAAATVRKKHLTAVVPRSTLPEHLALLARYPVEVIRIDGPLEATHAAAEGIEGVLVFSSHHAGPARSAFSQTLGRELAAMIPEDGQETILVAPVGSGALLFGVADAMASKGSVATVGALRPEGVSVQDGVAFDAPEGATRTVRISDADAHETRLALARSEGILVGMGTAAAVRIARAEAERGARVVVLLVDAGDRYFSVDRKFGGS